MREIRPLTVETWGAFEALVDKHNGIFGGCWCCWFHADTPPEGKRALGGREFKRRMVE